MVSFAPDSQIDVLRRDLILTRSSASLLRDQVIRQKQQLERVSAALCDGLGDEPASHWRAADIDAGRMRRVADLIEREGL